MLTAAKLRWPGSGRDEVAAVWDDSPRWEEINPSPFEHERAGLREFASYLPDPRDPATGRYMPPP
jgi:hypothetical protein